MASVGRSVPLIVNPPDHYVSCDIPTLVDRVFVSPTAPQWYAEAVSEVVAKFGLEFPISKSSISGPRCNRQHERTARAFSPCGPRQQCALVRCAANPPAITVRSICSGSSRSHWNAYLRLTGRTTSRPPGSGPSITDAGGAGRRKGGGPNAPS
jgi:hypothetical protein